MAYRFQSNKPVEANVRRILSEQLEKARYQLTENFHQQPAEAIHDARKRLKKCRSVLRLIRKSLDKDTYKQEKNSLRDTGRLLAEARDGEAFRETLRNLLDTYSLVLDADAFADLETTLQELHHSRLIQLIDHDEPMATVASDLRESHTRLKNLELDERDWEAVGKNLKKVYRQGKERFATAYEESSDQAFHEWRKRVKDLWYDTRLLQEIWPPVMKAFKSEVHQLAKFLGDDHDIAELRAFLQCRQPHEVLEEAHLKVLLPLMKHRQETLRQQAKPLGHRLYAETPGAFIDRIACYWHCSTLSSPICSK